MHAAVESRINNLKSQKFSTPILSIYLGFKDKKIPSSKTFSTQLNSLIKKKLNKKEQKIHHHDIEKIERYLREIFNSRNTRTVVFFAGQNLWEILQFEFSLPPVCKLAKTPHLDPILSALNQYKKYAVLLVDREKARIFTVHLGNIEEHKDIFNGLVPQRVKAIKVDWGRDNKIFRHIEDHLHRHLELIASAIAQFVQKNRGIKFMIIGGHRELLPKIKRHLPVNIQKIIHGEFITELNIPLNDVFQKSKNIASQIK